MELITHALIEILVPIGICVILPLGIFWLYYRAQTNKENKRTEIIMKALESNSLIQQQEPVSHLLWHRLLFSIVMIRPLREG